MPSHVTMQSSQQTHVTLHLLVHNDIIQGISFYLGKENFLPEKMVYPTWWQHVLGDDWNKTMFEEHIRTFKKEFLVILFYKQ